MRVFFLFFFFLFLVLIIIYASETKDYDLIQKLTITTKATKTMYD